MWRTARMQGSSASVVSYTQRLQMFWTLLLALIILQCGFCSICTVDYSTRILHVTSSRTAIQCEFRCSSKHQVRATIWTMVTGPRGCEREHIVYHTQEDEIDPLFRGRTKYLGDMNRDCTLYISDLGYWDEGNYLFTVVTDLGTFSTPKKVHLDFDNRAEFCELHIRKPEEEQEGNKAVWTCFSRNCRCRTFLHWYDSKNELITNGTSRQVSGQDISLSITLTWQDHQRTIRCSAYDYASDDNSLVTSVTQIQVKYIPKGVQAILLSPSANGMKLGDTVSMRCIFTSSNPFVSGYTWYKDGHEIDNQLKSDMMLENLKATDYGNYSCVAHNAIGPSLSSPLIRIGANDGFVSTDQGLKLSHSGLWAVISLAVVVSLIVAVSVPTWRYIKNKKKGNTTGSTEVHQRTRHEGRQCIYENADNHYTALNRSQISPGYDCLHR